MLAFTNSRHDTPGCYQPEL
uniref:Uncharacterized protein n=1 Tax=Anguilla anguilla TaxID=7936 RepID=A0A0E9QBX0_ANGAN